MVVPRFFVRLSPALLPLAIASAAAAYIASRYGSDHFVALSLGMILASVGIWLAISRKNLVYSLLVAVIPLEATFVIEAGFSVTPYYIAFGLLLFALVFHREKLDFASVPSRLLIGYLIICSVSIVSGLLVDPPQLQTNDAMEWRASALRPLIQLALMGVHVLFFIIVLNFNRNRENIHNSLRIYLGVGFLLCILGCWQTFAVALDLPGKDFTQAFGAAAEQGYQYGQTRFYSAFVANFSPRVTFRESLHFSHYLISFLPLVICLFVYRRKMPGDWRQSVPLVLVVAGLIALFLTMSRSGWIAFGCSLLFMLFFVPKHRLIKLLAVAGGLLVLAFVLMRALGLFSLDLDLWQSIQLRMDIERLANDPRLIYLHTLWSTFVNYPILGVGIGNYGVFGGAMLGLDVVLSAHSIFLNALVETGIIGFVALCAVPIHFMVVAISTIRRSRGYAAYPYLVGITAGVLGMTLQYCTFGDRPGFHYLFVLAIGYALIRYVNQNQVANAPQSQ